ncbi:MAG: gamma-glutamyl-gamma-aminobutyrate hydrolase family protein [Actinomycetota bacterium]
MLSVAVLAHRHVAQELGHLEPWFDRHGFVVHRVFREDRPEFPDADLLVVLGSPNSVATSHCQPPAEAEISMVAEWVGRGRPYLGVCFGAQVLARALGGSVRRMTETIRSYGPMLLSDIAPQALAGSWPLWHEDAITAPNSSTILAPVSHADTVFTRGSAWGIQPHIELTPDSVARLAQTMKIADGDVAPLYQAMKDDEPGLAERAGSLLDTFWASANSSRQGMGD